MVTQAIILAGGKGERLRPLTIDRPKPMVLVCGRPIVYYQLDQLRDLGIKEVVFACSHMSEAVKRGIGTGRKFKFQAKYTIEEQPLGRGGGIKKAMKELSPGWEDVLITNGDNLWKIDLGALIAEHVGRKALATITVVPLKSPYGVVEFNKNSEILGFKEKPMLPHWINAGVYVFNKQIMEMLPDVGDHETETFPKLPKSRFLVFLSENYWRGIDTMKDHTEAEKEVASHFPVQKRSQG